MPRHTAPKLPHPAPKAALADDTPLLSGGTHAASASTLDAPAGAPEFTLPDDMILNDKVFAHYMGLVEMVSRRTGLEIHVDQRDNALEDGDIYLFNHFTRFETVIAPYILHRETKTLIRSVAYHGLFDVNDTMTRILQRSGAVPTNLPRLLPFLAEEILRGRKVIIFPEGGLVKDKQVLDANGDLKMWSGVSEKVRKPHRGAAVLALMLDLAKRRIKALFDANDTVQIANWCERLGLTPEQLRKAVDKPTLIVPGNITFYPMRTNPNLLLRGFERFAGAPGPHARDELTIEGNLLLRPTDMDIRFGSPIPALDPKKRLHTALIDHVLAQTQSMDDIFGLKDDSGTLLDGYVAKFLAQRVDKVRDEYARRIYLGTTININHLMATLVQQLVSTERWSLPRTDFHKALYLMVKELQMRTDVNLHASLMRPDIYAGLRVGTMRGFVGFLEACSRVKLMGIRKDAYHFSRRLLDTLDLQDIRVENPIAVHANEAFPIKAVREVAANVLARLERVSDKDIAELRFDDMLREHAALRLKFGKKDPHTLLAADNPLHGSPYLLRPELPEGKGTTKSPPTGRHGVLLIHGFATTPADLRAYAEHLRGQGYTVLGLRLPGHGTSILDLEERHRREWLAALWEGYDILAELCDEVSAIGFSTGAALALQLAAAKPAKLRRVASVAAPLEVQNKKMKYVAAGMVLRAILARLPGLSDVLRFITYDRDITGTVYHRVPTTALNQLRLTIADMNTCLPRVTLPVVVVQGLLDRIVVPESATRIFRRLGSEVKALRWIAGGPHGLIAQRFGNTWDILDGFLRGDDVTGTAKAGSHKGEHPIVAPPLTYTPHPKRLTRKLAQWLITRKAHAP